MPPIVIITCEPKLKSRFAVHVRNSTTSQQNGKLDLIFLQKPNGNHQDPKTYRPIYLASVISKTFDRILCDRLRWFSEKHSWMDRDQIRFRRKRSTEHGLMKFLNDIETNSKKRRETLISFVDISSAFNLAWICALQANRIWLLSSIDTIDTWIPEK